MESLPAAHDLARSGARIAVLGAGSVGSAIAFALILYPVASEVLLVDPNSKLRDAQVRDLEDATTYHGAVGFGGVRIRAASHKEAGRSDIIIISAGAKQRPGESRTDLLARNRSILKCATNDMKPFRQDAVILLVANPVDILAFFCQKYSGLPREQVIGSGTFLDTARLRGILGQKVGVDAGSVDAYVLGEHGESQMVAWSCITIGAVPLEQCLPGHITLDRKAIATETRDKAAKIIEAKGATSFGIGALAAAICKSIISDQRTVRPVSHYIDSFGCCLSLPVVLSRKGIVRSLNTMPLNQEEKDLLAQSAAALRRLIANAEETGAMQND
ncbi:hypothetical protein LTR10_011689 [Elasticomyces elasticus]|uniref:L-lactate dehydrogenase n=1 Tax=Exophiala sideris TaxID=1016849 RepID=A0ABR0JDF6_9EURO|nr:hypothetical protein LTR10_011689 [Elasticomyces elasticus]KAK5031852.1 hypothetical protein LTS07_004473 [Exophiala sideris]KAK5040781.1 hypothetical protein LTR13_003082 [Exophiala sideris]KAK5061883.1 hypothetical protein LTR69_005067 [Exophiala sideris]KAK5184583.1 hypothetical protein LTR44_003258 [Eurotiomycetes sp. CCFEE 6388]